jgi:hypothetical protein
MWDVVEFTTDPEPRVVDVALEGARPVMMNRPGVELHQIEAKGPTAVAAAIMKKGLRPHGVVGHGLLAGRPIGDIDYLMRSLYLTTDPVAEVYLDTPDPEGEGLLNSTPPPVDHPLPDQVEKVASETGWDHVLTKRLSPGRSVLSFRKRILTETELIPAVNDVLAGLQRIDAVESRLSSMVLAQEAAEMTPSEVVEAERKRADEAEEDLNRLRNRRSVRLALAFSHFFRPLFRAVRSWKNERSPRS